MKSEKSIVHASEYILQNRENCQNLALGNLKFKSNSSFKISAQIATIRDFAIRLPVGECLFVNSFKRWCNSNKIYFNFNNLILEQNFAAFSKATIRACLGLEGICKKDEKGNRLFFAVVRNCETGDIFGFWNPWNDDIKKFLGADISAPKDVENVATVDPVSILKKIKAISEKEIDSKLKMPEIAKLLEEVESIIK